MLYFDSVCACGKVLKMIYITFFHFLRHVTVTVIVQRPFTRGHHLAEKEWLNQE